jgi:hypothetical protein
METRKITEVFFNWIKIKDSVPQANYKIKDPLYISKMSFLLEGDESLGNQTYQEWSSDVEVRLAAELDQGADRISIEEDNLRDYVLVVMFDIACRLAQQENVPADEHQLKALTDVQTKIILTSLGSLLFLTHDFPSKYLLSVIDDSVTYDDSKGEQEHLLAQCVIHTITIDFPNIVKDLFIGRLDALADLCLFTCDNLMLGRYNASEQARGSQHREAANIKNEPNRKTREYAIKLYNEKSWKNPRAASMKILNLVRDYGETVGFLFTDDFAAQNRIYIWLLKHKKDSEKCLPART